MKKIALVLASTALLFGLVSCASKDAADDDLGAPEGLDIFAEEDDGLLHLEYEYVGQADATSCADLLAPAKLITNKDYSKATPVDIYCDAPELVKFAGETAVKFLLMVTEISAQSGYSMNQ